MTLKEIHKVLSVYRPGSFVRVTYKSYPTLTAVSKKDGVILEKVTTTTTRFGCKYSNLDSVKSNTNRTQKSDYAETADRSIYRKKGSDQLYLQLEPLTKNSNSDVSYFLNHSTRIDEEEARKYIIKSYFNRNDSKPPVIRVKLENVISIHNKEIDAAL